ncbi:PREDICTED: uncharacterized protein LOC109211692 [Nicotiana attenuata]|uniref:uncharacterized protein LOC109211692 n=1 Tax=Nicotiana attenuata TaxID=49451 RepID=UPI000904CFF2|nr:PREDICTED: uncharacterized protein LOC109211692 [Nicotiana attenuata]
METAYANINGQIWLFFDAVAEWELVEDTEQQVTVRVLHHDLGQHMMMAFVYAKCSAIERLEYWDHLYYLASDMNFPWLVGGDFNVILHEDEKIGGLPDTKEVHLHGGMGDACIFKRLDRIFVNLPFQNMLPTIEVEHLIRTGSDHAPLLMTCGEQTTNFVKPFRVLNFWTKHATFMDVVRQNWEADFIGDPFWMFKKKLKRVKDCASKGLSELKKYLSIEEQYWKQKVGMTWFAEGDRNTSFFHNHVNGKRKKLQLKRIKSGSGVWIEDQEQLAAAAVDFIKNSSQMKNLELSRLPIIEEVRTSVFELTGESASGPDGFTGLFYQICWDVIGADIHNMVLHFYEGAAQPKSITHTNLVLLPKKPRVETFSDLRPISLSNFINKVLSRVLHDRLEKFLPSLISPNQSGFVKGRSIFENI